MTISDHAQRTDEEIRDAVVGWLRENLPADWVAGIENDDEELFQKGRAQLDDRAFLRAIGEAGWAMPEWEVEYSGAGLSPEQAAVVGISGGTALQALKAGRVAAESAPIFFSFACTKVSGGASSPVRSLCRTATGSPSHPPRQELPCPFPPGGSRSS